MNGRKDQQNKVTDSKLIQSTEIKTRGAFQKPKQITFMTK